MSIALFLAKHQVVLQAFRPGGGLTTRKWKKYTKGRTGVKDFNGEPKKNH